MISVRLTCGYWCLFYGDAFLNSFHNEESAREAKRKLEHVEMERMLAILRRL